MGSSSVARKSASWGYGVRHPYLQGGHAAKMQRWYDEFFGDTGLSVVDEAVEEDVQELQVTFLRGRGVW